MDITQRIGDLPDDDLQRLLKAISYALSGDTLTGDAFALVAEVEALAIAEQDKRDKGIAGGWVRIV